MLLLIYLQAEEKAKVEVERLKSELEFIRRELEASDRIRNELQQNANKYKRIYHCY